MTSTLKLGERGEVILDEDALHHLGVKPGETLSVEFGPTGEVSLRAANDRRRQPEALPPTGRIEDTFGMLNKYYDGPPLTIEEISGAIEEAWAGKR